MSQSCGSCEHLALLRAPIEGIADHFGTGRTGICARSYDGARVLLVSELFGSACPRYRERDIDWKAAVNDD